MHRMHLECATLLLLLLAACGGCTKATPEPPVTPAPAPATAAIQCLSGGDGFLRARLRGAVDADIDWDNESMRCEGGMRPDGKGIRVSFAGILPGAAAAAPRHVRFLFGIDLTDTDAGEARVLPTNLTVIFEGEKLLFATLGDDKCAVEQLDRAPLPAPATKDRVQVRGYCTDPADNATGDRRLLIATFDFAGYINTGDTP